jgi:hypothetical protein
MNKLAIKPPNLWITIICLRMQNSQSETVWEAKTKNTWERVLKIEKRIKQVGIRLNQHPYSVLDKG